MWTVVAREPTGKLQHGCIWFGVLGESGQCRYRGPKAALEGFVRRFAGKLA